MIVVFIAFIVEGAICTSIGLPNASIDSCEIASLYLLLINTVILISYIAKRYRCYDKAVVYALILSVVIKILLILFDYYATGIFVLPNSHSDSESFHYNAIQFARNPSLQVENYAYIVGTIYYLFGIQRMTAQFFNVILSFIGISTLEKILSLTRLSDKARNKTLILSALLPNYMIISSILIRECVISVLICFSLYFFIRWWIFNSRIHLLTAFAFSFFGCYFHGGAVAAAVGYSISIIMTRRLKDGTRQIHFSYKSVILSLVFFLVFMSAFSTFSDSIFKKFGGMTIDSIDSYIDDHNFYEVGEKSEGSSDYAAGVTGYRGISNLIINSPIRMIYFLWVPMPWMIRGIGDIIAFFGSSLFYGTTAFRGIFAMKNRPTELKTLIFSILMCALSGALVFAWGVESAGSALRHREKFYYIYLLLFALLEEMKISKRMDTMMNHRMMLIQGNKNANCNNTDL